jgi:hypothetical protein
MAPFERSGGLNRPYAGRRVIYAASKEKPSSLAAKLGFRSVLLGG